MFAAASSYSLSGALALLCSRFSGANGEGRIDGVWVEDRDAGRGKNFPTDADDGRPFIQSHRDRYDDKSA